MTTRIISIAFFCAYLLGGCVGLRPGFEEPNVSVSSFKPIPSEGSLPQFEIGLRVSNPNAETLNLVGIAYTIEIEGNELINGVANNLPAIAGYSEEEFKLTASVSLLGSINLLRGLMEGPQDVLAYEFKAKLDPGPLQPSIRVREKGEFSMQPQQ